MGLNIALVGCGFMGRMHANVLKQLSNAELVGVCDADPARTSAFGVQVYDSFDALLADPRVQAVDVCLPTDLHAEFSLRAIAAGKHVMCEKPMARTVAEAESMREAAARGGVRLMIGHCIRFWPEYARLKSLAESGELGALRSLNLTRYGAFPTWSADGWLADERRAGGGALDMHIHDTDFALYLLGEPGELFSRGTLDSRGVSQIFTTLGYGPVIVHLEGGWNLPAKTPFKHAFRAIFERGAAIMDGGPLTLYADGKEPEVVHFDRFEAAGGGNISDLGGYYHELKYFVDRILADEPFEIVTPDSSIASLRLALREIELAKAHV